MFFAPEVYYDDYRIYSGFEYDPEKDEFTYGLRRADLKKGGSEFFGGTTDSDGNYLPLMAQPWFVVGDRLYLEDGKCFFSLNKDGGDRKDLFAKKGESGYMYTDGEYVYYREDDRSSIIRRSLDGGEPETVVSHAGRGEVFRGRIDMRRAGFFETSYPFRAGYSVTVDGESVRPRRSAAGFLVVPLAAGNHELQIDFLPPGYRTGLGISLLALLLFTLQLKAGWRGRAGAGGKRAGQGDQGAQAYG